MNPKPIKTLLLLATLACLSACEEHVDYQNEGLNFDVDQDLRTALQNDRMPVVAARLGCTACHAIDHRVVGPAWKEVGKRYQNAAAFEYNGKSYPLADGLVQKISHGGSGNWGQEAMPGVDPSGSKHELIEKLVGFILALGKR